MTWLTRRERDAFVAMIVAFGTSLIAGFLTGLSGFENVSAHEYGLAVSVWLAVGGIYLVYRGGRRAIAAGVAYRAQDGEEVGQA